MAAGDEKSVESKSITPDVISQWREYKAAAAKEYIESDVYFILRSTDLSSPESTRLLIPLEAKKTSMADEAELREFVLAAMEKPAVQKAAQEYYEIASAYASRQIPSNLGSRQSGDLITAEEEDSAAENLTRVVNEEMQGTPELERYAAMKAENALFRSLTKFEVYDVTDFKELQDFVNLSPEQRQQKIEEAKIPKDHGKNFTPTPRELNPDIPDFPEIPVIVPSASMDVPSTPTVPVSPRPNIDGAGPSNLVIPIIPGIQTTPTTPTTLTIPAISGVGSINPSTPTIPTISGFDSDADRTLGVLTASEADTLAAARFVIALDAVDKADVALLKKFDKTGPNYKPDDKLDVEETKGLLSEIAVLAKPTGELGDLTPDLMKQLAEHATNRMNSKGAAK